MQAETKERTCPEQHLLLQHCCPIPWGHWAVSGDIAVVSSAEGERPCSNITLRAWFLQNSGRAGTLSQHLCIIRLNLEWGCQAGCSQAVEVK